MKNDFKGDFELKFKKIISAVLSAVLLVSSAGVTAFAENKKEYNYVALGDSIAAGFGLHNDGSEIGLSTDHALMVTEELINDPIPEAYAQVFGGYLEELGKTHGYKTTATNLSAVAYRAEDVEKTILEEGYKGPFATWIFETFVGKGASVPLAEYHEIFNKYLKEAELISIQLGGNDIVMGILNPMMSAGNPVLTSMGVSIMLTLFGCDMQTSIGGGLQTLANSKDDITYETITEAAEFLSGIAENALTYVDQSAAQVKSVVEAVKTVNDTADIALIGMFNPYGNSLEYDGQVKDMSTVIKNIFARAAEEVSGKDIEIQEAEMLSVEELEELTEDLESDVDALSEISAKMKQLTQKDKEKFAKLAAVVADEISYPLQYTLAGKSVEPQMLALNEKLKEIADATGAVYIDVYNIRNECNLDPHPNVQGHHDIADIMYANLSDMIAKRMTPVPEQVVLNKTEVTLVKNQKFQLAAEVLPSDADQTVKFNSSNRHVATVDQNGVVTAKKEGTAVIRVRTPNGKTTTCKITVKKQEMSWIRKMFMKLLNK